MGNAVRKVNALQQPVKYKTSNDMKEKIKEICNKLNREQISVQGATEQLFDLYNVVRQSEQLVCPECKSTDCKTAIHTDYKECNKCYHYWEAS